MDRRLALQKVGFILGTSFISTELFLTGCKSDHTALSSEFIDFNPNKNLLLMIGKTIIPAYGKHPGFDAVNAIDTTIAILNDCYKHADKKSITDGLEKLNKTCKDQYKLEFSELSEEEKVRVIAKLDELCFDDTVSGELKPVYFKMIKEAILLSYFTTEIVFTNVFNYTKVPGKYDGAWKIDPKQYDTIFGLGI